MRNVYFDDVSKKWYIHFRKKGIDGKYITLTKRGFLLQRDAADALFSARAEAREKSGEKPSDFDFSMCIDKWIEHDKTRMSSHTVDNDIGVCRHYIIPELGHHVIQDAVSVSSIDSFRKRISSLPYTCKTKRKIIAVLRSIISYSVAEGWIPGYMAHPLEPLLEPFPYTGSDVHQIKRALTKTEYKAFISTFSPDDKYLPLFELFFYTGVRVSELRGIQWNCYDPETHQLFIHQQLQYSREKHKDELTLPKTKKSVRYLDLSRNEKLCEDLKTLARAYRHSDDDFMFFGTPVAKTPIVFQIQKHCKMADIKKFSPHEIRHTVASWLVANCKQMSDLIVVQRWLGHASLKETLDTYSHYLKTTGSSPIDALTGF